jgi:hypothetical protein
MLKSEIMYHLDSYEPENESIQKVKDWVHKNWNNHLDFENELVKEGDVIQRIDGATLYTVKTIDDDGFLTLEGHSGYFHVTNYQKVKI